MVLPIVCLAFCVLIPISAIDQLDLSGCGTTKGCVTSPKDCKIDCRMAFTYHTDSGGETTLEFFSQILPNDDENQYVAVGFSSDMKMGNDTVIQCSHWASKDGLKSPFQNNIALSENVGKNNRYLGPLVFAGTEYSYSDKGLLCRVKATKDKLDSLEDPRNGKKIPLSGQRYIMLATGTIDREHEYRLHNQVMRHSLDKLNWQFPVITEEKVEIFEDFNSITAPQAKAGCSPKSGWAMAIGFVFAVFFM